MALEHGEDSCQLLRNSPAAATKVNHNTAATCMQLKTGPIATTMTANTAQYYHQRAATAATHLQQQQQQQQQRPDVMLMTTTQAIPKASHQQHHQQQQQYQQQQLLHQHHLQQQQHQLKQQQYSRSATPSPQHHFQHPLQTFHIVSTASANSSPTHQTMQRQYAATLQPQRHQQQQHQHQQQQHFVAVPTSMIRFQTSATASGDGGGCGSSVGDVITLNSNIPPNCYQSATTVPVSASATIYFPILTTQPTPRPLSLLPSSSSTHSSASSSPAPPATSTNVAASSQQLLCNQPIVKYHTIQLQHKKPFIAGSAAAAATATVPEATTSQQHQQQQHFAAFTMGNGTTQATTAVGAITGTMPLPPPPAYQTATVHGVRRAKFLTKPLPQEINNLLAENDISCRSDLLQNTSGSNQASSSTTAAAATVNTATAAATCNAILSNEMTTTTAIPITSSTATTNNTLELVVGNVSGSVGATSALGSTTTVDIMEDEEENEQQRLGNCPHGTPSRVPLISASAKNASNNAGNSTNDYTNASSKDFDKSTRGLINATTASFHRHTLHTFQRGGSGNSGGQRKTTTFVPRRGCNMLHATSSSGGGLGRNATAAMHTAHHGIAGIGGCYGDTTETSDDDEYMKHGGAGSGNEQFVLTQLVAGGADADDDDNVNVRDTDIEGDNDSNDDGDSDDDDTGPQVPISIVLLILICYICLGTVIFAFWENWSIIDGAYFCFVTLATIGYGDFLPERTFHGPQVQLFACCAYLLLGLVLVAMSFSILETQLMWKCKRIAVRLKLAKD